MIRQRKQIRLINYDYSQSGLYYVTICTQNRECLFGNVLNGKMELNDFGKIIVNIWESLPNHHPVELDMFQIMPNHIHFVIQIIMGGSRPAPTLGTIVGLFKSECTKQFRIVGATRGSPDLKTRESPWQRNYYEHIIRNENELTKIRQYIKHNPLFWNKDINNPTKYV